MEAERSLILLTNDDGIFSKGLTLLEDALMAVGDVYVVAPDRARSGASHALTLGAPIYVRPAGPNRFSTSGTPTDCVNIGVHRLLPRKPDLLVSGINLGGNLCEDVTYSGTVAAALEATLLGIPSLAFSLVSRGEYLFDPAVRVASELSGRILKQGLPPGVLFNVNIPNLAGDSRPQARWTRLGNKYYGDFLEEGVDDEGRPCFRFGEDPMQYLDNNNRNNRDDGFVEDWRAVKQGHVSITPLCLDTTNEDFLLNFTGQHGEDIFSRV